MSNHNRSTRIIIIGGGFAGVKCARRLLKRFPGPLELVLFNRTNHMVFQPLLADVAGSALNPRAIAAPLRQLLRKARCRTETVVDIDFAQQQVRYEGADNRIHAMSYDHVVIACGNKVNLDLIPGMANHALPLKTIGDAIAMRSHVMEQLERADAAATAEQAQFYLSFIVVGGGFSGVEVAGEINDLARGAERFYPNIKAEDICVTLLHSQDLPLPEVSDKLRAFALAKMRKAGIDMRMGERVVEAMARGVRLRSGETLRGGSIICTVGNTMSDLVAGLAADKERGRLVCDDDLSLAGQERAWAIGDCAHVRNALDGEISPATAQFAERQGKQCADNIVRLQRGQSSEPFSFKPIGAMCGIGGRKGVGEIRGMRFYGIFAYWLWRSAFLLKIPSFLQRIKVGLEWAWEVVFPRDISHFHVEPSEPVSRVNFAAGEVLLTGEDKLKSWVAIEQGEAEIVDAKGRVLTLLGAGDLIGEHTLEDYPDDVVLRARDRLQLVTMGREALSRLSGAFKPFERVLESAVARKGPELWQLQAPVFEMLETVPVTELMEPLAGQPLRPEHNLKDAFVFLRETGKPYCYLTDENNTLCGLVTRSDVYQALGSGKNRHTPIAEFMTDNPICVRQSDNLAVAAVAMRDHQLKWVPVISDDGHKQPIGTLRGEDLLARVLLDDAA